MTDQPQIVICENPDPADRDAILQPLIAYNRSVIPSAKLDAFAILLRGENDNTVMGGLWGVSAFDWFFVELLFIPETMRRSGIGTQLMQIAEQTAVTRGCIGIWLDSFSFQAPGFYTKLGYEEVGIIPHHPKGHRRIIFRKLLTPTAAP